MDRQSESSSPLQTSTPSPPQPTSTSELLLSLDLSKTLHLPVKPRPNCCDICGRYFSRYDNLERHRRTHLNQKLFDCEECGKSFSQKSHLKEHSTVHTGEHPYKCHICDYAFSRRGNLSRHIKTHQQRPTVHTSSSSVITTATLLRKATSSISDSSNVLGPTLDAHHEPEGVDVLGEDPDSLGVDSSSKSIISAFSRHHRRQHGDNSLDINSDNPFGCKACWRAFSQGSYNSRNKVHQRIHTALKPYKCDLCPKSFSQKSHLKVHRRIHTGEKPFSCPNCAFMFSRNDHLERHMRTHHGQKMYRTLGSSNCGSSDEQCGPHSEDTDAQNVSRDKDAQSTNYKYTQSSYNCCCNDSCEHSTKECKHNSESNNTRPDLNCHSNNSDNCNSNQRTTTPNGHLDSSSEGDCESSKPLDCSLCWRAFSKRSHESMHKKIHHAVLPYKCNVCGKAFPLNGNLTRHKRTHVGEKRFQCDVCGKAFSQRSHVKVHELIHVGNRPYKCNDCGYTFRRPDHLMRHKQANAGKTRLSCIPRHVERKQNCSSLLEEHATQTDPHLINPEQIDIRQVKKPLQNPDEQPLSLVQQVPLNVHAQPVGIPYYNNVSVAGNLVNVQSNQASISHPTSLPHGVSHHHTNIAHNINISHHSLPHISALPQHLNIPFHPNLIHAVNGPPHRGF